MWGTEKKGALKLFLLLVTLAVPVIIFLFLKGFGENHYSVPIFYQQGLSRDTADCDFNHEEHKVDISAFKTNNFDDQKNGVFDQKLTVIDIDIQPSNRFGKAGYSLNRVADHFNRESSVQFMMIRTVPDLNKEKQLPTDTRFMYIYGNDEEISAFARCELILLDFPGAIDYKTRRFVLVDYGGRIRGYYPVSDFDEIDRMILEMQIILKEEY
jgi:protein SCO1/2